MPIIVGAHRVDGGEDHGLHFGEAGKGCFGRVILQGDGVADAGVAHGLDARNEVAHLARGQFPAGLPGEAEQPRFLHLIGSAAIHEADNVPGLHPSVKDPAGNHRAPVGVVGGVEDERGQGALEHRLGAGECG